MPGPGDAEVGTVSTLTKPLTVWQMERRANSSPIGVSTVTTYTENEVKVSVVSP